MATRRHITVALLLLLAASAHAGSFSGPENQTGNPPAATSPPPPDTEGRLTDAELEANQAAAEAGTVDTSTDSCARGCVVPADIDDPANGTPRKER